MPTNKPTTNHSFIDPLDGLEALRRAVSKAIARKTETESKINESSLDGGERTSCFRAARTFASVIARSEVSNTAADDRAGREPTKKYCFDTVASFGSEKTRHDQNMKCSVLGVDLACSWASIGSAILEFGEGRWTGCDFGVIAASKTICSPLAVANEIDRIALSNGCSAVSIDGPQGWRDPHANRSFVGRLCEMETRTPGKTGTYNRSYPETWLRWITFSISVFDQLLSMGHAILANNPDRVGEQPPEGRYFLLECFPTSTWRSSGLSPLKGHWITSAEVMAYADQIRQVYDLPKGSVTDHHDNLQAVVSALPAAGFIGGPCIATPRGDSAKLHSGGGLPDHRVEGLIWDASPLAGPHLPPSPPRSQEIFATKPSGPISLKRMGDLPPALADPPSVEVLKRGVELFNRLVKFANSGDAMGVGYGDFVARVNGVRTFKEFRGRPFTPSDIGATIGLAVEITRSAGGRQEISRGDTTIMAGMDTFIWSTQPLYDRSVKAWESKWSLPPYARQDWKAIFPDGKRKLLP